jgi:hypothetical protein
MSLFTRRHAGLNPDPPSVPGLAEALGPRGWQPVTGTPFDGHLEEAIHDARRAMHGYPRGTNTAQLGIRVGGTVFRDAFTRRIDGRDVVVANGWTEIETETRYAPVVWHGTAVCAVALPTMLPMAGVQSRQLTPRVFTQPVDTGDPAFDAVFVTTGDPAGLPGLLTPDVRAAMLVRDDWSFLAERYWFGCVTKGGFRTPEEVLGRVDAVHAVVAAMPEELVPAAVEPAVDDLLARIERLTTMEEAFALLQGLTPDDRARLAASDSALAAFADVRTPQEAMARLKTLDPMQRMQVAGMFMRVRDQRRR